MAYAGFTQGATLPGQKSRSPTTPPSQPPPAAEPTFIAHSPTSPPPPATEPRYTPQSPPQPPLAISKLSKSKGTHKFTISNTHVSIVNGLRRTILGHLPTLGMVAFPEAETTIRITQNSSPFHNELLKQRLACIAFNLNPDDELAGRIEFRLNVENTMESEVRLVTVADATLWDSQTEKQLSPEATKRILPADPITGDHALLLVLQPPVGVTPGGSISLTASLKRVTPNDSGAYALASTCAYGHVVDTKARDQAREAAGVSAEAYPRSVWEESVVGQFNIPNTYEFRIRSVGWMNEKQLLRAAAAHMRTQLLALAERATNSALNITKVKDILAESAFDIEIPGDTYSLGHALRHQLYITECGMDYGSLLTLVGFDKKHAHDQNGELRIVFGREASVANAFNVVANAARQVADIYQTILKLLPQD